MHVYDVLQVKNGMHSLVIWKEREHETTDFQSINDPTTIEALLNCGLLKYFRVLGMKSYVCLLEYIIDMWDPKQHHFVVKTHTLTIDIEDVYFLTGLSRRGIQVVLSSPRGGEICLDDIIDRYCA